MPSIPEFMPSIPVDYKYSIQTSFCIIAPWTESYPDFILCARDWPMCTLEGGRLMGRCSLILQSSEAFTKYYHECRFLVAYLPSGATNNRIYFCVCGERHVSTHYSPVDL